MGRELKRSSGRTNNPYMYTANAVAPEYQWQYEEETKVRVQPKQQTTQKTKVSFLQVAAPNLRMLCVLFAMGLFLVGQYVYIQNVSYNINQSREELKVVAMENEKLKTQVATLGELETIEAYAVNQLGMVKPTQNNIMYLAQNEKTYPQEVVQNTVQEESSVSAALTALLGVVE